MKKLALFVDVGRDGYTPKQCGSTMTVGQLVELLSGYNDDTLVYLRNDNGYTYGSVLECSFEDGTLEDDD